MKETSNHCGIRESSESRCAYRCQPEKSYITILGMSGKRKNRKAIKLELKP